MFKLGHVNRLGNVFLVLAEESPEDSSKPLAQAGAHACVDVVLVMPQLMGELLTLHRQRDRDDDIGKPSMELTPGRVALEAETEVRANRRPAHSADTLAGREDWD